MLIVHLVAVAIICAFRFAVNWEYLLDGTDGAFVTFSQYPGVLFTDPRSIISISPYFGFGSNFAGPSPFFDPVGLVVHATGSAVAGYVVLTLCLFLSVYALARALGTGGTIAAISAWLMVILLMPIWRAQVTLADIFSLIHTTSTFVLVLFCFTAAAFLALGTRRAAADAALAAAFVLLTAISWLNNLTYTVLTIPFLAAVLGIATITAASRQEFFWKIAGLAAAIGLFLLFDVNAYLDSFTAYSRRLVSMSGHTGGISPQARTFLMNLVNNNFYAISKDPAILYGAPFLGWLGIAGLIHGAVRGNLRWRLLCLAGLGFIALLTLMSAEFALEDVIWPWAAPSYFERAAFPFYAIAGVLLIGAALEFILRPLWRRKHEIPAIQFLLARRRLLEALVIVFCVVVATAGTLAASAPGELATRMRSPPHTWPKRDSPWPAVARLVEVAPDRPFAGWFLDLAPEERGSVGLIVLYDNIHIWRSGGGTLFEVGPEVTLQMDALERLKKTVPLPRYVGLLGAFGLAYARLPAGTQIEGMSEEPALMRILPGLRRVPHANLGTFTPTSVMKVQTFQEFEKQVISAAIDWRRTVFLDPGTAERVGETLLPAARTSAPIVVTNGLRIEAESGGQSLLLLPRQFSNCYQWHPAVGSTGKVSVVRANMLQLALLFEGTISGELQFRYRWFGDHTCRSRDPAQAQALGIVPAPVAEGRIGLVSYYTLFKAQQRAVERAFERASRLR